MLRIVGLVLVYTLTACVSKPVHVVSFPAGATINYASQTCIAPCDVTITPSITTISAQLEDGRRMTKALEPSLLHSSNLAGNSYDTAGDTMHIAAGALGILAILSASLAIHDNGDEDDVNEYDRNLGRFALGAGATSFVLYHVANSAKKANKPHHRIEFDFIDHP